jgi:hypothetical protein
MAAKDGSFSFDFGGVYTNVETNKRIEYTLGDGRKVKITFSTTGNETKITETFDTESTHSIEMQRGGWQAILEVFLKFVKMGINFTRAVTVLHARFVRKKENPHPVFFLYFLARHGVLWNTRELKH